MERKMLRIASVVFVASVLIGVVGCAKPKVQVQVSKTTVSQGEEVRVNWTSKDAKQVTLNGNQVDKNNWGQASLPLADECCRIGPGW